MNLVYFLSPRLLKCAQGKHVPWEDAQEKTKLASQEAHRAEVAACKAHKHLSSVAESQQEAEAARTRLAEVMLPKPLATLHMLRCPCVCLFKF